MSGLSKRQIERATLARQTYGLQMAQVTFGGPRGVWLECREPGCGVSHVIVGSRTSDASEDWYNAPDAVVAKVFRRHGWTGNGPRMTAARCPEHSHAIKASS
jgi:hypothetical protein